MKKKNYLKFVLLTQKLKHKKTKKSDCLIKTYKKEM